MYEEVVSEDVLCGDWSSREEEEEESGDGGEEERGEMR